MFKPNFDDSHYDNIPAMTGKNENISNIDASDIRPILMEKAVTMV